MWYWFFKSWEQEKEIKQLKSEKVKSSHKQQENDQLKDSIEEILSMVSIIEHNLEKYEEVGLDHFDYALKKTRELKDYVIETIYEAGIGEDK